MGKRKAIIFDLDGTLFNNNKEITDFNIEKVNKCYDLGHVIIIATARPLRTVMKRLPSNMKTSYLVLCNGAWVVKGVDVLFRREMDGASVKKICDILKMLEYQPAIEANNCFYKEKQILIF